MCLVVAPMLLLNEEVLYMGIEMWECFCEFSATHIHYDLRSSEFPSLLCDHSRSNLLVSKVTITKYSSLYVRDGQGFGSSCLYIPIYILFSVIAVG